MAGGRRGRGRYLLVGHLEEDLPVPLLPALQTLLLLVREGGVAPSRGTIGLTFLSPPLAAVKPTGGPSDTELSLPASLHTHTHHTGTQAHRHRGPHLESRACMMSGSLARSSGSTPKGRGLPSACSLLTTCLLTSSLISSSTLSTW